jgi:hypothetical protein
MLIREIGPPNEPSASDLPNFQPNGAVSRLRRCVIRILAAMTSREERLVGVFVKMADTLVRDSVVVVVGAGVTSTEPEAQTQPRAPCWHALMVWAPGAMSTGIVPVVEKDPSRPAVVVPMLLQRSLSRHNRTDAAGSYPAPLI